MKFKKITKYKFDWCNTICALVTLIFFMILTLIMGNSLYLYLIIPLWIIGYIWSINLFQKETYYEKV